MSETVSKESQTLADDFVDAMHRERIFHPYENGYKIDDSALKTRLALVLEASWQQGVSDAEAARRVSLLRS